MKTFGTIYSRSVGLLPERTSKWFLTLPCAFALLTVAGHAQLADSSQSPITVEEYVSRLQSFEQVITACQRSMNPDHCQSNSITSEMSVMLPSGERTARYEWLRQLLDNAAKGESANTATVAKVAQTKNNSTAEPGPVISPSIPAFHPFHPPTLSTQLEDAHDRLADEVTAIKRIAAESAQGEASLKTRQREVLSRVLAAKEYQTVHKGPTLIQQIKERIGNWINRLIGKLIRAGAQSRWIGLTAEITFGILLCLAIAWLLIRFERQGRAGPIGIGTRPGNGAASARDWQLWLEDARKAAAIGAWRDAIHLLYWASISRLESTGHWPADRARTPREYLVLLGPDSQHRVSLRSLTRSLEYTWYAGREADEADYQEAERLALQLSPSGRSASGAR